MNEMILKRNIYIDGMQIQVCGIVGMGEELFGIFLPEDISDYPLCILNSTERCYLIMLEVIYPFVERNKPLEKDSIPVLIENCREWVLKNE
jgi:hypothetical protein